MRKGDAITVADRKDPANCHPQNGSFYASLFFCFWAVSAFEADWLVVKSHSVSLADQMNPLEDSEACGQAVQVLYNSRYLAELFARYLTFFWFVKWFEVFSLLGDLLHWVDKRHTDSTPFLRRVYRWCEDAFRALPLACHDLIGAFDLFNQLLNREVSPLSGKLFAVKIDEDRRDGEDL